MISNHLNGKKQFEYSLYNIKKYWIKKSQIQIKELKQQLNKCKTQLKDKDL